MFKTKGKFSFKILENLVLAPIPMVWKSKNPYIRVKQKLSKVGCYTYQNLCEKATKRMEKELAQSDLPVRIKIKKTQKFTVFKKVNILSFLGE